MGALWFRNDVVASRRRCDLLVNNRETLARAPRETDFTGYLYISKSSHLYAPALGTLTNKRFQLTPDDDIVEATDLVNNTLTLNGHSYEIGDGPIESDTTAGNLTAGVEYWVIPVDANTIRLAESLEDAYAGTAIDLDADATGATLSGSADTERGIDGEWVYEGTQDDSDVAGSEIALTLLNHPLYDAYTTIGLNNVSVNFDDIADLVRGIWAVVAGPNSDFRLGTYTFYDPETGTKPRLTVTADESGRRITVVGDLT